ncbi:hypothetical protein [Amycolatopsis alkalitolerans]|uniref:Uncharacterized protein n=1 Tax=Amycolatopsis alkalitolerans TaxID=2547244 RepID=A0A5C4M2K6_9PSEU|nr:hypothetical protein [Amycolatopsis alkalitolerans]TNC27231.1 hypothetical protein FG385_09055 [Amycolatopsis alkalitolerans]
MRKVAGRALVLGFFATVSVGLALPGTAVADTDPALSGDCATTLGANSGQALTLDAGAPLNQPHVLTLGTGSNAANSPALHLDVADLAKTVNLGHVPATRAVADACTGAQGLVNSLSATTQTLLGGGGKVAPPPAPPGGSPKPPSRQPPVGAASPADLGAVPLPLNATSPAAAADLSSVIAPLSIAPVAQGVIPPTGAVPGQVPPDSGSAQALPAAATAPAKLPLLLAAIALALAAAALAHYWLRRRPG